VTRVSRLFDQEKDVHVLRNLRRRKLRSALTIAGISIGIVALVVFGAMANKIDSFVNANVDYIGGSILVTPVGSGERVSLPLPSSALAAVTNTKGVAAVAPSVQLRVSGTGSMPTTLLPDTIVGVDPAAAPIPGAYRPPLAQGREMAASDASANVTVLGADIALRYGKSVGDGIELRGERFEVIGVYAATTALPDSQVRVPIQAARRLFVASLPEQYRQGAAVSDLITEITVYPAASVDPDDLAARIVAANPGVQTMTGASARMELNSITRLFDAILMGIALLSLVVGGLSVVNTMAMAVAERTREIGIKRAIGGSRARVVRDVVTESAAVGMIGGLIGLAVGAAIAFLGNELGRSSNTILFDLTPLTALEAVLFATVLGGLAGLIPALNAARLDPVAALRYE
jgi:putative ABC transport system permease protein